MTKKKIKVSKKVPKAEEAAIELQDMTPFTRIESEATNGTSHRQKDEPSASTNIQEHAFTDEIKIKSLTGALLDKVSTTRSTHFPHSVTFARDYALYIDNSKTPLTSNGNQKKSTFSDEYVSFDQYFQFNVFNENVIKNEKGPPTEFVITDPVSIEIETHEESYLPGEIVTGFVDVSVARPIQIQSMKLWFKGEPVTEWVQRTRNPNSKFHYFDYAYLHLPSHYSKEVKPGFFAYFFEFKLPKECPPTYHNDNASFKNFIKLEMIYAIETKIVKEMEFIVNERKWEWNKRVRLNSHGILYGQFLKIQFFGFIPMRTMRQRCDSYSWKHGRTPHSSMDSVYMKQLMIAHHHHTRKLKQKEYVVMTIESLAESRINQRKLIKTPFWGSSCVCFLLTCSTIVAFFGFLALMVAKYYHPVRN